MEWIVLGPSCAWHVGLCVAAFVFCVASMGGLLVRSGVPDFCAYPLAFLFCFLVCAVYPDVRWLWRAALLLATLWPVAGAAGLALSWVGIRGWWAHAGGALFAVGLLSVLLWTSGRRRAYWVGTLRLLLRGLEDLDIAEARRAAGTRGRLHELWLTRSWTDAPAGVEEEMESAVRMAPGWFAHLTGLHRLVTKPVRFVCFQRSEAFAAYTGALWPSVAEARGYYCDHFANRVVVNAELSLLVDGSVEGTVAHEMTHHLLCRNGLGGSPPWLEEGIACAVAAFARDADQCPGAVARLVRVLEQRGELLRGSQVVSVTRQEFARRRARRDSPQDARFVSDFCFLSTWLVWHLIERHGEAFKVFLASRPRIRRQRSLFNLCFGISPDEALSACLAPFRGVEPDAYVAPPEARKARIENVLVPLLLDPGAPPRKRRLAIAALGSAGYPWRVDALIGILERKDDPLRDDALRTLEAIAGELRGDDPGAWRAWFATVPEDARGPYGLERPA